VLALPSSGMTDAGLARIAGLTHLHELWLGNTKVTDAGLAHLAGLTHLEQLDLTKTKVTDAGVKKLQRALPHCKIDH